MRSTGLTSGLSALFLFGTSHGQCQFIVAFHALTPYTGFQVQHLPIPLLHQP